MLRKPGAPLLAALALTSLPWSAGALAAGPVPPAPAAPASPPATGERRTIGAIERALLDAGLENVTVAPGGGIQVAFENRRFRRTVEALAVARAAAGEPV